MPFVPQVPGVPILSSYAPPISTAILVADTLVAASGIFGPPWGIFLFGVPAVIADSVISLEFRKDWSVSDYPLEQGAFESYDRVEQPFETRIRFAAGGSSINKFALLESLQLLTSVNPPLIFDVVTPEMVYQSVSISHYDYRRTARNGVGLLQVDVFVKQVRVTASTQFTSTQQPSGASPQGGGLVQPSAASSVDSASLGGIT